MHKLALVPLHPQRFTQISLKHTCKYQLIAFTYRTQISNLSGKSYKIDKDFKYFIGMGLIVG